MTVVTSVPQAKVPRVEGKTTKVALATEAPPWLGREGSEQLG
jgi:hypothetical protein